VPKLCSLATSPPGCRTTLAALALWLGAAACSGEPASPEAAPAASQAASGASAAALPAAPASGRTVVAEVDGAPVYDDCVIAQARAHGRDRRAAVAECIAFELLAQEAQRRGLAADPEVRRVQKIESVRRLIDLDFRARYPGPDSVPRERLEQIHRQLKVRYQRPELRETAFLRRSVPAAEHPPGSPADLEAKALMERVYASLAGRRGLTFADLEQAGAEIVTDGKLESSTYHPIHRHDRIVPPYLEATFAIPEPGMVSPPFRTEWGWDIVLLVRIHEAVDRTVDEVADELFELLRRQLYQQWEQALVKRARVTIDEAALDRLQQAEERARFADDRPTPAGSP
jgi:peptidyl-prolyl cis-trans isomerase C